MIESLMLCGIGVLAGCVLMLFFFPLVHERAVRLTTRRLMDAKPQTASEIQTAKDHMRAQFAMSVRRLEIGMEEMRAKAMSRAVDKQNAEISRLQVELDKKAAMILALRAREDVRKRAVRRIVKLLLYLLVRSKRRRHPAPALFAVPRHRTWTLEREPLEREPDPRELASTAAAIAAVNLKRRRAVANRQ